ncbi:hypothetical protein LX15_005476 [Streptoalloteichus tenebrarius]|uniref:Uncharacterized protein n=1 Tax=Streptoalloteichus tenebrarius (strain ATCC 17920 / DSM 40477 / JCM 4838 / CBS 697.72 / NBRC 16177 / NCIMB 11028 / NRRL B-12390 / A12253. 1 / ISP 5477) TaxID=1933 RepID=A0ABT1I1U1_STRSD|nr:hypothetical protein [Streptoalloteichus tenebrarius]MCP2261750.1 hypothetical protein [Streptoalloteichus tenebrarius]BFF00805.1 hypothetical protein GCM10020241_24800 [Streptoalloteichus tenebrarius]
MLKLPKLPPPALSAGAAVSVVVGLVVGIAVGQHAWREDGNRPADGAPSSSGSRAPAEPDGPPMDYEGGPTGTRAKDGSTFARTPTPTTASAPSGTASPTPRASHRASDSAVGTSPSAPRDRSGSDPSASSVASTSSSAPATSSGQPSASSSAPSTSSSP